MTAPVDDGLILVDNRHGTVYHLNRTGAVILAALTDTGGTIESAIATMVDRYRIDKDQARADVIALVYDLRARGLVISR
ncbi:MAG: HPr-rel-A system PqqD family peptide chaperone [Pseudonocardiaceae bacterium]